VSLKEGIFSGFSKDKELNRAIKNIFGFRPGNIFLYDLAFRHHSAAITINRRIKVSNERLEYLGDAVLSAIVAEYLFKTFPSKDEGFLTQMRSKIVNREQLNKLVIKLGIEQLIHLGNEYHAIPKNLYGDTFEALVGAIYLDKGYLVCKKVIINRVIKMHYDIDELISTRMNYKSLLLEWAQYKRTKVEFRVSNLFLKNRIKQYKVDVLIDNTPYASAVDYTIRGAEKLAAEKTWEMLEESVKEFYSQKKMVEV
jgi:ribonuclease-3